MRDASRQSSHPAPAFKQQSDDSLKAVWANVRRIFIVALMMAGCHSVVADDSRHSVQSDKASSSLLLDVTRAGSRLVAVGDRGHILYSDDDGRNWTQAAVPTIQLLTSVTFANDKSGWAVGHDALILNTTDGGESWTQQFSDPEAEVPLLDVWFKNAYDGFAVGAYGYIMMTNNGGKTWNDWRDNIENEDEFHYNSINALQDGTVIIAGEAGVIYRSTDSGETFDSVESPYDGSFFGVIPTQQSSSALVYGLRGHLFRSDDSGESWDPVNSGTEYGLFGGLLLDDSSLVIVGGSGTILKSYDNGVSLTLKNRTNRMIINAVTQAANGDLILVGQGGVHVVASNGAELAQQDK